MKKYIVFILMFLLCFLVWNITAYEKEIMIIIDAGHGGKDGGCSREYVLEKELNLAISFELKEVLETYGYKVLMTRNDDIHFANPYHKKDDSLARAMLINKSKADLFLSIHLNHYTDNKYYGSQVFYHDNNADNVFIADTIQNSLVNYTNTTRKIKKIDSVIMLRNVKIPGCIIECGFLSNDLEFELLKTTRYQKLLAKAIAEGVYEYLLFKV